MDSTRSLSLGSGHLYVLPDSQHITIGKQNIHQKPKQMLNLKDSDIYFLTQILFNKKV